MIPLVVHVEDLEGGSVEDFAFIRSPVRIGRGQLNDLPLSRPVVSTYHGLIQFDDEEARFVDLGSTNGSVLDGAAVEPNVAVPVAPGGELIIGSFRLTFERRQTGEHSARRKPPTAFTLRAAAVRASPPPMPEAGQSGVYLLVPSEPDAELAGSPVSGAPGGAAAAAAEAPGTAERADAAVEAASLETDLQYASYRGAWDHLRANVEGALSGLEGAARQRALEQFARRYPAMTAEPSFQLLAGAGAAPPGAAPAPAGPVSAPAAAAEGQAMQLLQAFAEAHLRGRQVASARDVEVLLTRVELVLETFAWAFIELRRGFEEFGREVGVRTIQGDDPVHRAREAGELVTYLLDPEGRNREDELQRGFAEMMGHHVGLLRGVSEGARAMLSRLSPESLEAAVPRGVWGTRPAALWKAYSARFHDLADEDRAVHAALFGKEFARAYAAVSTGTPERTPAVDGGDGGDDEGGTS